MTFTHSPLFASSFLKKCSFAALVASFKISCSLYLMWWRLNLTLFVMGKLTNTEETKSLTTILHFLIRLVFAVSYSIAGKLVIDALPVSTLKLSVDAASGVFSYRNITENVVQSSICMLLLINPGS